LPAEYRGRTFSIGSPTPHPFWFLKTGHVIEGDAEAEDLAKRFGHVATNNSVLSDLGNLLNDARSGQLRQRKERWTADEIAAGFGDVFYEPPVHSRYWVTRYKVAVANARAITQPQHPIDIKLRRVALEWLKRFAPKTDFLRLVSLIDRSENGIITRKRTKDILFAFLVHKTAIGNFRELVKHLDHPLIQENFPFGINYHFERAGWPTVPFSYQQPRELVDLLKAEIKAAKVTGHFEEAAKMTFLLYRKLRVPRAIDDLVMPIFDDNIKAFHKMRKDSEHIFADRQCWDGWGETAAALLRQYDRLMLLDGILNGDARLSKVIVDRRFGVDAYYINELKKYTKRQ
jgi:hypothetical protein